MGRTHNGSQRFLRDGRDGVRRSGPPDFHGRTQGRYRSLVGRGGRLPRYPTVTTSLMQPS